MAAEIGHNSGSLNKSAQDQLKTILDRIETITDNELAPAKVAISDIYKEAKGSGYNPRALRRLVALRAKDKGKLMEENAILQLYAHAIGCEDLV